MKNNEKSLDKWNENQELVITKLEGLPIDNCLEYKRLAYKSRDWDNIPTFVAKFLLHLEKYVKGLSSVCHEFHERETVLSLRKDIT